MPRKRDHTGPWLGREPGHANIYIYWYDERTRRVKRRSTGTSDERLAQEKLGLFIIEAARGEKPGPVQTPDRYPIATALRWYLQERAPQLASGPQAGWANDHLLEFFGSKAAVASITPEVLKRYERERRAARGTVRRELAVLSAALAHAVKNGRLTSHPKIILPAPGPGRTRHLDEEEIAALLAECREPHLRLFVLLAVNTGARKGALLELRWQQIDFAGRLLYLNPEGRDQTTKRRATVPISDELLDALREAQARAATPYVIEYQGAPILDVRTSFASACRRAGLRDVTPHVMRHTAGTLLAKAGVDLHKISRLLGHSYQKTTELYAHHRPEWLRDAVDVLGRATRGSNVRASRERKPEES